MNVLVIDIGGTHVKLLVTGQKKRREFVSGEKLTPRQMVAGVKKSAADWKYDAVSIGFPGPVRQGRPVLEPWNLGKGWKDFNYRAAFKCPVKIVNDAVMQALGSYRRGKMLFLGLGTGLGSTLIADGVIVPMELAHLPYKKSTFEDYVGIRGLEKYGRKKWRHYVADVVLGGGNVKNLKTLPPRCRAGDNANSFIGGFRLWEKTDDARKQTQPRSKTKTKRKK